MGELLHVLFACFSLQPKESWAHCYATARPDAGRKGRLICGMPNIPHYKEHPSIFPHCTRLPEKQPKLATRGSGRKDTRHATQMPSPASNLKIRSGGGDAFSSRIRHAMLTRLSPPRCPRSEGTVTMNTPPLNNGYLSHTYDLEVHYFGVAL